jgi:hypothetical protein
MTEPVGGYRGGSADCFEASLDRLDRAADEVAESESELQREIALAIVDTVEVAAVCVGGVGGSQVASCIVAAARHLHTLVELSQQVKDYEREVAEYEAALAEHLACLSR